MSERLKNAILIVGNALSPEAVSFVDLQPGGFTGLPLTRLVEPHSGCNRYTRILQLPS